MGLISLIQKVGAVVIGNDWYNDFLSALSGDFVGRNSSGVPTSGQNCGNALYPWGVGYFSSLFVDGGLVDLGNQDSPPYKIVSGKTRSISNQPAFLLPSGSGASATLQATSTPLVLEINGQAVTISADIAITGLTVAPSSNNTCLLNEPTAASQVSTRMWGENNPRFSEKTFLNVDNMGSNVSSKIGSLCGFKIVQGGNTEYFTAFVTSSTILEDVKRGFFYNSSSAPMNRILLSDNAVISIMSLAWVYVTSAGAVNINYNNPTYSETQPTSPATNDYWFDLTNRVWKQYDGATWNSVERHLIGLLIIDTANCIGARSFDFFASVSAVNTMQLEAKNNSSVWAFGDFPLVNVAGTTHRFGFSRPTWDMASHLATSADMYNASEQSSAFYFFYLSDRGERKISDIQPYWRADLLGWYHPHEPWRYVGDIWNNSSSDFDSITFQNENKDFIRFNTTLGATSGSYQNTSTSASVAASNSIFIRPGSRVRVKISAVGASGFWSMSRNSASTSAAFDVYYDTDSGFGTEQLIRVVELAISAGGATSNNLKLPIDGLLDFVHESPKFGYAYYRIKGRVGTGTNSENINLPDAQIRLEEVRY